MFVLKSKYDHLEAEARFHIDGLTEQCQLMQSQIDRQAKYIEELKRRNANGTFKAENTDFLTRD